MSGHDLSRKIRKSIFEQFTNQSYQVNPSDAGIYDRIVVQDLIKTVAQTGQLDSEKMKDFKVVVITGNYNLV